MGPIVGLLQLDRIADRTTVRVAVMFGPLTDAANWLSLHVLLPTQHLWQPLLQAWMDWRY